MSWACHEPSAEVTVHLYPFLLQMDTFGKWLGCLTKVVIYKELTKNSRWSESDQARGLIHTFCQSDWNWTLLSSVNTPRSASLASHADKWLKLGNVYNNFCVVKSSIWAKEGDIRSFFVYSSPAEGCCIPLRLWDGLWWPAAQSNLIPCFLSPLPRSQNGHKRPSTPCPNALAMPNSRIFLEPWL